MAGLDECCCGRTDHLTDGGGSKKPVPKTIPARTQTCTRRRYYGNKNLSVSSRLTKGRALDPPAAQKSGVLTN